MNFYKEVYDRFLKLYQIVFKNVKNNNIVIIYYCFLHLILTSCSSQEKCHNFSLKKLEMTIQAIENLYVDTINSDKLVEDAIISLLKQLDPYSSYMTIEEVDDMNESLRGNFDGIGIQFNILSDTLYVIQVTPGGPSSKVGLVAGDRIIEVNNKSIVGKGLTNIDIIKRLRGKKGTIVRVKIIRNHHYYPTEFKIVRDRIPTSSLDASYMLDKKIGYIKLNCFGATTYEEFKKALKKLKQKGLKSLILDLQDNGGGYLQTAIDITSEFLKKGSLIVYTEGAHQGRAGAYSSGKRLFQDGKVVVLINEATASASEIISGALQDWDRAVIIGRRSFGKGLVQCPITLIDGSMLKLTTARYYTPTGRSIQKPYKKMNKELYEKNIINRYKSGEIMGSDSIHFNTPFKYHTLVNKRVVYGGGGIMPDYFIPIDNNVQYENICYSLFNSGIINKFIINFFDKNRFYLLSKYKKISTYKSKFYISDEMLKELLNLFNFFKKNMEMEFSNKCFLGELKNINENEIDKNQEKQRKILYLTTKEMNQNKQFSSFLKLQLKALIARDLWSTNEYYQIINEKSKTIKKAMEIIKDDNLYYRLLNK